MKLLSLLVVLLFTQSLSSQIIAFVGFDADNDIFAFVTLENIPNGSSIEFDDNEWSNTTMSFNNTGESEVTWTNSTGSDILAGTVISVTGVNINASNEGLYAYVGAFNFLTALFTELPWPNDSIDVDDPGHLPPSLSLGSTAINIDGDEDAGAYTGSTVCSGTIADCLSMINNPANWTTSDGDTPSSAATFAMTPSLFTGSALPVELINFEAKSKQSYNLLTWTTASETNNDRFEIERSSDGQDFHNIGTVNGRGQSSEVVNYSFEDNRPLSGMNFYRLKQVDFDEQFEYSFIVNIENGISLGEAISLSLEGSNLSIQVSADMKVYGYSILAYDGRQLMRGDYPQDATDLSIDLSQLEIGNYILHTQTSEGGKAMRFTKPSF